MFLEVEIIFTEEMLKLIFLVLSEEIRLFLQVVENRTYNK